mgnify:CR=1 FL=1
MLLRKLNLILSFYFILSFCNAQSENQFKFHKLKISSFSEKKLEKIGFIKSNIDSYPYAFSYYANTNNNKLSELIEIFYFDNFGDHMSRFNRWSRSVVFISNPNEGCNNSSNKIFHRVVDNGQVQYNCFSTKLIPGTIKDLSGPNFNNTELLPMVQRESFLKKFFKKKQIKISDNYFRSEHYLYKSGKLIWVFYSVDTNLFFEKSNKKNLEKLTNKSMFIHNNFENNLRFKYYMKINFINYFQDLYDKGNITLEEFEKFKKNFNQ